MNDSAREYVDVPRDVLLPSGRIVPPGEYAVACRRDGSVAVRVERFEAARGSTWARHLSGPPAAPSAVWLHGGEYQEQPAPPRENPAAAPHGRPAGRFDGRPGGRPARSPRLKHGERRTCACGRLLMGVKMIRQDGSEGKIMPLHTEIVPGDGKKNLVTLDEQGFGHMMPKAGPDVRGREVHWGNCPHQKRYERPRRS